VETRPGGDLGEKWLSADLEGDGAYIPPYPFSHRSISQPRRKALLVSGCVTTRD
jgi:hypothetical protein